MKELVAALVIAAFAGMTLNAFAGSQHGGGIRDIDKDSKKHGKRHHKADKEGGKAEKTEKADDAKK